MPRCRSPLSLSGKGPRELMTRSENDGVIVAEDAAAGH
jgi:hypothetical protein